MGILLIKVRAAKENGLGMLFKQAATRHTLWIYPVYLVIVVGGILLMYPIAISGVFSLLVMAVVSLLFAARKAVKCGG